MVCGLRLALSSFIAAQSLSGSWVVLVVRVGSLTSNPSLPSFLYTISPFMGTSGCVIVELERVIGVMGRWEVVRGRLGDVLGRWFGAKNHGRG
ncbi:hypothetical protein Tco_0234899, partial [Tanacetum coccineum]